MCGLYFEKGNRCVVCTLGEQVPLSTDPLPLTTPSPFIPINQNRVLKSPPRKVVPLPPQAITARLLQISGDAFFGPKHLPVPFSLYQPKRLQKKYCPSPLSDDRVGFWHCHFAVLPAKILILATLVPNTHDFRSS